MPSRTLEYFNNENEYKNNSYYPSKTNVERDLRQFEETFNEEGVKGVKRLRKLWGYKEGNDVPNYSEAELKIDNCWKDFRKKQISFLEKFLLKYEKE